MNTCSYSCNCRCRCQSPLKTCSHISSSKFLVLWHGYCRFRSNRTFNGNLDGSHNVLLTRSRASVAIVALCWGRYVVERLSSQGSLKIGSLVLELLTQNHQDLSQIHIFRKRSSLLYSAYYKWDLLRSFEWAKTAIYYPEYFTYVIARRSDLNCLPKRKQFLKVPACILIKSARSLIGSCECRT